MESPDQIIAELSRIYDAAVACLRDDIAAFAATGTAPPPERRRDGSYCYPELRVHYGGEELPGNSTHSCVWPSTNSPGCRMNCSSSSTVTSCWPSGRQAMPTIS